MFDAWRGAGCFDGESGASHCVGRGSPRAGKMTVNTALAMDCDDHLWVPILVADKIERCMFCTTVRVWQLVGDRTEWVYYRHRIEAA